MDAKWFSTPLSADFIRGALDLELKAHGLLPHRLPVWAREQIPDEQHTIRDGHPTTPLLVVSPLLCPIHEDTPGPAAPDLSKLGEGQLSFVATGDPADATRLTLTKIRDELVRIVAARATSDPQLFHLDGRELYGDADYADLPLPDQLHLDAAAHRRIGERFAQKAFGAGRPLDPSG